jgi:hypothetical protein
MWHLPAADSALAAANATKTVQAHMLLHFDTAPHLIICVAVSHLQLHKR